MIKIGLCDPNGFTGYSSCDFVDRFNKICNDHLSEKRARLFAFLLYNLRDASVIKALEDKDYWNSLDEISGNAISVFALHFPNRTEQDQDADLKSTIDAVLLEYFGTNNDTSTPSILFFQVADNEVLDYCRVELRSTTVEDTYLEMKEVLSAAAKAVSKVTPENWNNPVEDFILAESKLYNRQLRLTIKRGISKIMSLKKITGLISGILEA